MKRGFILINAYDRADSYLYQPRRLQEAFAALGIDVGIVPNGVRTARLDGGAQSALREYDFGVYLDKDRYASVLLEACGIRLFNRAAAVAVCDDKAATHIALAAQGLPQPATVAAPLCYTESAEIAEEAVRAVVETLRLPVVVKTCYGSLGKGVFLARTEAELRAVMRRLKMQPHLFQRFVAESAGRDMRVLCVGGRAVAAMRRVSVTDFRSNAELGGGCEPCALPEAFRTVAEAAARALDLDYCGVDLLYGADGPLVCEVNSNAFFGGMERATGIDIARIYAEYIAAERYGRN